MFLDLGGGVCRARRGVVGEARGGDFGGGGELRRDSVVWGGEEREVG